MKTTKTIKITVIVLTFMLAMAVLACTADVREDKASEAMDIVAAVAVDEPVFTLDELATYDGQNDNPAYIAIDGIVYDVSNVPQWLGGKHNGFTAGKDLTAEMASAPHGFSKLTGLPKVGILTE